MVARAVGFLTEILFVPGGFPIRENGEIVGGVGIAAGHYTRDQELGEKAFADGS